LVGVGVAAKAGLACMAATRASITIATPLRLKATLKISINIVRWLIRNNPKIFFGWSERQFLCQSIQPGRMRKQGGFVSNAGFGGVHRE
jgi:hypothetical protein